MLPEWMNQQGFYITMRLAVLVSVPVLVSLKKQLPAQIDLLDTENALQDFTSRFEVVMPWCWLGCCPDANGLACCI